MARHAIDRLWSRIKSRYTADSASGCCATSIEETQSEDADRGRDGCCE